MSLSGGWFQSSILKEVFIKGLLVHFLYLKDQRAKIQLFFCAVKSEVKLFAGRIIKNNLRE
jgi:hypothetical protein